MIDILQLWMLSLLKVNLILIILLLRIVLPIIIIKVAQLWVVHPLLLLIHG